MKTLEQSGAKLTTESQQLVIDEPINVKASICHGVAGLCLWRCGTIDSDRGSAGDPLSIHGDHWNIIKHKKGKALRSGMIH